MANEKFSNILRLIRAVFELIAELIPVADVALGAVETALQAVKDFKKELNAG